MTTPSVSTGRVSSNELTSTSDVTQKEILQTELLQNVTKHKDALMATCLFCHTNFPARTRRAKFCSSKHRVYFFRARQTVRPPIGSVENAMWRQLQPVAEPLEDQIPIALPDLSNSELEEKQETSHNITEEESRDAML